jgi:hypothetical protein
MWQDALPTVVPQKSTSDLSIQCSAPLKRNAVDVTLKHIREHHGKTISFFLSRVMDENTRSALKVCRPNIMRDLDVKFVLPFLISDGIISDEEKQIIEHEVC